MMLMILMTSMKVGRQRKLIDSAIFINGRIEGIITEEIDGVGEWARSGAFVEFFDGFQDTIWFEVWWLR